MEGISRIPPLQKFPGCMIYLGCRIWVCGWLGWGGLTQMSKLLHSRVMWFWSVMSYSTKLYVQLLPMFTCHRMLEVTPSIYAYSPDKTVGIFHLQSPKGKYQFTYEDAEASCAAEGATLATIQQLSAAQQVTEWLSALLVDTQPVFILTYESPGCSG